MYQYYNREGGTEPDLDEITPGPLITLPTQQPAPTQQQGQQGGQTPEQPAPQ